jgi:hypothetical protein
MPRLPLQEWSLFAARQLWKNCSGRPIPGHQQPRGGRRQMRMRSSLIFTILRNVWLNGRRRIWPPESPLFEDADGVVSIGCGPQRFFRWAHTRAPSARQNLGPLPRRVRPKVWKRVRGPREMAFFERIRRVDCHHFFPTGRPCQARTGVMENASDDPRSQFLPVNPGLGQRGHFLEMSG